MGASGGEACDSASARVAVELRDVWFRYERDGADVLRGTTLTVPGGSLFAVVGGNGTGKSTMLRAICGVARPYRGKITVLGRRLKEWKKAELFRGGSGSASARSAESYGEEDCSGRFGRDAGMVAASRRSSAWPRWGKWRH